MKSTEQRTEPYQFTQAEFLAIATSRDLSEEGKVNRELVNKANGYARQELARMAQTEEGRKAAGYVSISVDAALHRACVVWAMREGILVWHGVIADYPDLADYWYQGVKPFRTTPPQGTPERENWEGFPGRLREKIKQQQDIIDKGIFAYHTNQNQNAMFAAEIAIQRKEDFEKRLVHIGRELERAEYEDLQEAAMFGRQREFALGADEGNCVEPFRTWDNLADSIRGRRNNRVYEEATEHYRAREQWLRAQEEKQQEERQGGNNGDKN